MSIELFVELIYNINSTKLILLLEDSMEPKYFYCYSPKMKQFFCENGLRYITRSVHEKTGKPFWVFESGNQVTELLNKWKANRPSV
jgi:hypothetical protein